MKDDYLVELVTSFITQQRFTLEEWKDIEFDTRLNVNHALEDLKHADMYFVGPEFNELLHDYHDQNTADGRIDLDEEEYPNIGDYSVVLYEDVRFDAETRPPSKLSFIVVDQLHRHISDEYLEDKKRLKFYEEKGISKIRRGYLCRQSESGEVDVRVIGDYSNPQLVGSYTPKGKIDFAPELSDQEREAIGEDLVYVGGAFSLINQPRFVIQEAAGTRQQRKAAKRQQDIALEAWHRIRWNIDDSVTLKNGEVRSFHMPYHYTRGHYRKAQPHWDNVEWVYDGWHKWIESYWSGHPAYGIKRGYHAPTRKAS